MEEYISRKKAISAIRSIIKEEPATAYGMGRLQAIKHASDILTALPAADVQPINQWISVKDRLPNKDGNYLCYLECGEVCQSTFDSTIASDGEEFPFGEWVSVYDSKTLGLIDSYWEEHDAITHWMPLPEPPKEGEING